MFETAVTAGVCRLARPGGRWLATGFDGGYHTADAAYNVSVPTGFERTDLDAYAADRLAEAGFESDGPRLLTGVDMRHARGARRESVTAVATAGITNPAALPVDGHGTDDEHSTDDGDAADGETDSRHPGTVNLLVGTTRALDDGALATLLATAVEAKTATLQQVAGVSGTTTDAVAVGCDPSGDPTDFAGSGTAVGAATRVCVRDALLAGLGARYDESDYPETVADADHGVVTGGEATTFRP
ncbi:MULTISPECIES: adenosylcobinamide amidohydrolase [Salinibaculum]|uniref:adenosylcobinamide amidohydrolase n=1 Tax=Salinibaculum TaxID=2732368 RepID=UPI0030D20D82